jgi:hypothetical protein
VRYVQKYRTFSRTTHNNQLIDRSIDHRNHVRWPPNHRTMATRAIRHHRWCLPLPLSPMRPSILTRSQRNSLRPPQQHKEGMMLGWSWSLAEDVLGRGEEWDDWPPTGSNQFVGRSGERWLIGGCNNQLGRRGRRGIRHNNFTSELGASSEKTTDDLTSRHNNQPHKNRRTMSNESMVDEEPKETNNKQQSAKLEGGSIHKFCCCLVFISFYSCNKYLTFKLHQSPDYNMK